MALILTEEQAMLRESARDFLAAEAPVSQLRQLRDGRDADGFSRPLWARFADMGFTGILVPESQGGLGLGAVEAGVVMEQIGHTLVCSPFMASCIVAVTALRQAGSPEQQARWLPRLASGELIATLAVDETLKHRPEATAMRAAASGSGFVLEGAKTFVVDGHVADLLLVAARTAGAAGDSSGISLFAVERASAGLSVERTVMVDAHNAARVRFDKLQVGADALLGGLHQGWAALQSALDAGRLAAAAELMGLADEVFARTVQYLKERKQFDRLIGEFQGLQHRCAHLYAELEISRSALIKAQQQSAAGGDGAAIAVAIAKARAGRTANLAVQECVQMHGGIGMTDEFEAGFFMKRARVLQELFGDASYHIDRLARSRGY